MNANQQTQKTLLFSTSQLQLAYFKKLATTAPTQIDVLSYKDLGWSLPVFRKGQPISQLMDIAHADFNRKANNCSRLKRITLQLLAPFKVIEALLLFNQYQKAIAHKKPRQCVVWNGLKFRQKVFSLASQTLTIDVSFMENGLISGMTTYDGKGVNFINSVPRDPAFFIGKSDAGQCLNAIKSIYQYDAIPTRPTRLPARYIFLPLQVDSDSQICDFSPWIKSMKQLLEVIDSLKSEFERLGIACIVKPHPKSDFDYQHQLSQLNPHMITIEDIPTNQLVWFAEAVITVNSTVGLESLIAGKPTMVLGQAFYALPGLAKPVGSSEELTDCLQQYPMPDSQTLFGLINYLVNEYQVPGDWRKPDQTHLQSMCERINEA